VLIWIKRSGSRSSIDQGQRCRPQTGDDASVKAYHEMHEVRRIEATLARLELWEGVASQTVRQLALHARIVRAARGELLVRCGERTPGVFAVLGGSLKARLQHDGGELILALLGEGAVVGVAATVLDHPSKADLVALEESLLVLVEGTALMAQMARDPRLARNVAGNLATKAQALMAQFEYSMRPTLQRLAAYLQSIAEPGAAPEGWTARLPVSKTAVAARLGMTKETLSRLLRRLARQGVIAVSGRAITILDSAGLARISGSCGEGAERGRHAPSDGEQRGGAPGNQQGKGHDGDGDVDRIADRAGPDGIVERGAEKADHRGVHARNRAHRRRPAGDGAP
jgi:CRP/FNR family transcriptional regulator